MTTERITEKQMNDLLKIVIESDVFVMSFTKDGKTGVAAQGDPAAIGRLLLQINKTMVAMIGEDAWLDIMLKTTNLDLLNINQQEEAKQLAKAAAGAPKASEKLH